MTCPALSCSVLCTGSLSIPQSFVRFTRFLQFPQLVSLDEEELERWANWLLLGIFGNQHSHKTQHTSRLLMIPSDSWAFRGAPPRFTYFFRTQHTLEACAFQGPLSISEQLQLRIKPCIDSQNRSFGVLWLLPCLTQIGSCSARCVSLFWTSRHTKACTTFGVPHNIRCHHSCGWVENVNTELRGSL